MIPAIIIGREGSKGFPNKNLVFVDGTTLFMYPAIAALRTQSVDRVYLATDSYKMKYVIEDTKLDFRIIDLPKELTTDDSLAEGSFIYAYNKIKEENPNEKIDYVVLMFANAPCITSDMINNMVHELVSSVSADSICTISKYNMFSPYRMRTISDLSKSLINFVQDNNSTCDRNDKGDFYIYDCSCAVVKAKVLENIESYPCPQRWLGNFTLPYIQKIPAIDVDYEWQMGQIEYWLRNHEKARN